MTDIRQHVEQLLYELDSLIIPNLGGFVSSYKPASVDHIQGFLHPPSKKLIFNKNLLINDGVFVNYLQKELSLSVLEAEKMIEDFVIRTIDRLDNREIVVFPGVGRLYKDYENNLQFLQDNTNFNTEVYGLPSLQYYPILRSSSRQFVESVSTQYHQPTKIARKLYKLPKAANALIPIVMIAIIAVSAFFYINGNYNSDSSDVKSMPVAENRINTKPVQAEQLSIIDGLKNQLSTPEETEINQESNPDEEPLEKINTQDTEAATLAPDYKECVIIIGAFGKKAGVERRVKEIIDLGYSVYQDKKGKLTRVGIQFIYQDKSEIREKLNAMRDNFDNRSWILSE